jgi:flagellar motor switch protein FliM
MNPGGEHIADTEAAGAHVRAAISDGHDSGAGDSANPSFLPPRELGRFRKDQEKYVRSAANLLSEHLHLECTLKLSALHVIPCNKLAQSWVDPSHFTLFKMEPLRGVSVLEFSSRLGSAMVDRLMGGSGEAAGTFQEMGEIEQALLEPTAQLLLEEWCRQWSGIQVLKPSVLGHESDGRFIQFATPDQLMLVLAMDAGLGGCQGRIQIAFPFVSIEALTGPLIPNARTQRTAAKTPASPAACKWNACFDEVPVPVTAEWDGLELTSRAVLDLKIGDVVPMNPQRAQQLSVRLAGLPKFHGRPGTVAGRWAVELTQAINS